MLSMESMIKIQAAGAGEDGRPLRPAFQKNFALFVVPFMFPRPGPCCKECGPGGEGNRGREIWDITDDPVAVPKISALPYGGRLKF